MGRTIRRVPKGWEHPKDDNGRYHPLHDINYLDALNEWFEEHNQWLQGNKREGNEDCQFYAEYAGDPPCLDDYRKYTDDEAICYQIYENVSEGTPVSPVFETIQQMEDHLVSSGYSRNAAKQFCETGYAPSAAFGPNGFASDIHTYDL